MQMRMVMVMNVPRRTICMKDVIHNNYMSKYIDNQVSSSKRKPVVYCYNSCPCSLSTKHMIFKCVK